MIQLYLFIVFLTNIFHWGYLVHKYEDTLFKKQSAYDEGGLFVLFSFLAFTPPIYFLLLFFIFIYNLGRKSMLKIILVSSLLLLTSCGFEIIDTGNRGVKVRLGEVIGEPLQEGLYFYNPVTTGIKEISVRETKEEYKSTAYSKDAQVLEVEYVVNFRPLAGQIHTIYKEVGYYWQEVLLKQILEGNMKEVVGRYAAVELIEQRQSVTNAIIDEVKAGLLKKRVELISIEITNMNFDNEFEEAIKRKVIAVEQAKEAVNKTVRVREESEQQIISAKAEAESMRIRSNALSQNKSLVEYEAVQKWDGKLPQYMMGNSVPFINLNSK